MKGINLEDRFTELVEILRSERNEAGFWSGKLSSSSLATAVSVVALKINNKAEDNALVINGLNWLLNHVNSDGGYGDTPQSKSNVSTTLLCYAAVSYCGSGNQSCNLVIDGIRTYLSKERINLESREITSSVLAFYGNDYTFSVPILSMLVICGVLDSKSCDKIPQLPFEFTLLPTSWYSLFNLHVVSYAIPALVAVGIFVFKSRKRHNPLMAWIRKKSINHALRKLENIVPESGGFLEAIPLTAFVSMCLISSGYANNGVVNKGIHFLQIQQRQDGSWPIDTDLSTWVTTLSVKSLGSEMINKFSISEISRIINHLESVQSANIHPFNQAQPGGWGWTNFSGSVPDVDDTCGAILALLELQESKVDINPIINGCKWLLSLQNKDGGFPTFCKGWGRLPFDSSCADLTGHVFLALTRSREIIDNEMPPGLKNSINDSIARALGYLWKVQEDNGCWIPLWFGNQHSKDFKNPVYGTAKVVIYLRDSLLCHLLDDNIKVNVQKMLLRAQQFLLSQQNDDGSWGGEIGIEGSIEESALAISALAGINESACIRGFDWLQMEYVKNGLRSNPIGLYFAMLWYDEKLFPIIYYIEAIRRYLKNGPSFCQNEKLSGIV